MRAINSKVNVFGLLLSRPLLLLGLLNILIVWVIVGFGFSQWHDENAVLENIQAALLLCGSILGLPIRSASRISNALRVLFCVLCVSFLLRELDIDRMDLPMVIQVMGSGEGRVFTLALLWSFALYRLYSSGLVPRIALTVFVRSPQFRVLLAVIVLLLLSLVFDKQFIAVTHPRLFEELAETNAYLLLVIFTFPIHSAELAARHSTPA